MMTRRQFSVALALLSASPASLAESDRCVPQELFSEYRLLKSYRDTIVAKGTVLGLPIEGTLGTVFVAPDFLCVQVVLNGKVRFSAISSRDRNTTWSDAEGIWTDVKRPSRVMASLKGATVPLGLAGHWISSLLVGAEVAYGQTLLDISDSRCRNRSDGSTSVSGDVADSEVTVVIGAANKLISSIEVRDQYSTMTMQIRATANAVVDIDGIAARVYSNPSHRELC